MCFVYESPNCGETLISFLRPPSLYLMKGTITIISSNNAVWGLVPLPVFSVPRKYFRIVDSIGGFALDAARGQFGIPESVVFFENPMIRSFGPGASIRAERLGLQVARNSIWFRCRATTSPSARSRIMPLFSARREGWRSRQFRLCWCWSFVISRWMVSTCWFQFDESLTVSYERYFSILNVHNVFFMIKLNRKNISKYFFESSTILPLRYVVE